ncbi:MAG: hypothetical protein DHS20C18_12310 [Saprospiraceae bacterium]|nr:MAG: hypothetical protein DHS20C18_12310 [Saprospiraceae bacterium]
MDSGQMKSIETDKTYQAEEMRIVEYHRFEGNSNPSDLSVIYAIYCKDGNKGTIVSTYGPYADMKLSVFMDKVKIIDPQNHNNGGR